MTPYLLILAVLLGIAPGLIAHGKGRNFLLWWIYGVFLGPVALLHAILLRQKPNPYSTSPGYSATPYAAHSGLQRSRWRSSWPIALWGAASVAIAIVAVTGYGLLNPAQIGFQSQEREISVSADRTPPTSTRTETQARRGSAQSIIADRPAAEQPARLTETPTVRVSVRHETLTPPPEKTANAPTVPVERLAPVEPRPAAPQSLERTEPIENKATNQIAARTEPAWKTAPPAAAAPPPAPPVATLKAPTSSPADRTTKPAPTASAVAPEPPKAPAAKPAPAPVTAVGETVQIVQLALVKKGYDPGPANGRAGVKTQAAVRKFQSDIGLQPTGAIDYDLLEKLGIVGPRVHSFRPPPGASAGR